MNLLSPHHRSQKLSLLCHHRRTKQELVLRLHLQTFLRHQNQTPRFARWGRRTLELRLPFPTVPGTMTISPMDIVCLCLARVVLRHEDPDPSGAGTGPTNIVGTLAIREIGRAHV